MNNGTTLGQFVNGCIKTTRITSTRVSSKYYPYFFSSLRECVKEKHDADKENPETKMVQTSR